MVRDKRVRVGVCERDRLGVAGRVFVFVKPETACCGKGKQYRKVQATPKASTPTAVLHRSDTKSATTKNSLHLLTLRVQNLSPCLSRWIQSSADPLASKEMASSERVPSDDASADAWLVRLEELLVVPTEHGPVPTFETDDSANAKPKRKRVPSRERFEPAAGVTCMMYTSPYTCSLIAARGRWKTSRGPRSLHCRRR